MMTSEIHIWLYLERYLIIDVAVLGGLGNVAVEVNF